MPKHFPNCDCPDKRTVCRKVLAIPDVGRCEVCGQWTELDKEGRHVYHVYPTHRGVKCPGIQPVLKGKVMPCL